MTLIELIVVMALLATIFTMAAPKMSAFFRGRALTEETRRFIALTKLARSEAVSRSVPVELWVDPELGAYGLRALVEYASESYAPTEWLLADTIAFDIGDVELDEYGHVTMVFLPDGTIDEGSLAALRIVQEKNRAVDIKQAAYGLGYYAEAASDETMLR